MGSKQSTPQANEPGLPTMTLEQYERALAEKNISTVDILKYLANNSRITNAVKVDLKRDSILVNWSGVIEVSVGQNFTRYISIPEELKISNTEIWLSTSDFIILLCQILPYKFTTSLNHSLINKTTSIVIHKVFEPIH